MLYIFRFCKPYLAGHKLKLFLFIVLCVVVSLASLLIPYITGNLIDALATMNKVNLLYKYLYVIVLICTVKLIGTYITERLYLILHTRTGIELNAAAVKHIQNLSPRYMEGKESSFVNQQVNHDSMMTTIFYNQFMLTNLKKLSVIKIYWSSIMLIRII